MVTKQEIENIIGPLLDDTDLFIVSTAVTPDGNVTVELDSDTVMDIDTCTRLTRALHDALGEKLDDCNVEVGSAGLTAPLRLPRQYTKNIGNELDLLTTDGRKFTARLTAVTPDGITVEQAVRVKEPGAKRPVTQLQSQTLPYALIKRATYRIDFK